MNPRRAHPIDFFNEWFAEPIVVTNPSVAAVIEGLNRHPLADDQRAQDYIMPMQRCREHAGRFRIYGENQDTYYCFVYEGDESKIDPAVSAFLIGAPRFAPLSPATHLSHATRQRISQQWA